MTKNFILSEVESQCFFDYNMLFLNLFVSPPMQKLMHMLWEYYILINWWVLSLKFLQGMNDPSTCGDHWQPLWGDTLNRSSHMDVSKKAMPNTFVQGHHGSPLFSPGSVLGTIQTICSGPGSLAIGSATSCQNTPKARSGMCLTSQLLCQDEPS